MSEIIKNRYEFVLLLDVKNGNPNGDPDAANAPRVDHDTGYGYITNECLKHKIRHYVDVVKNGEPGFGILIKPDRSLNAKFTEAYIKCDLALGQKGENPDDVELAKQYINSNYFDVRTFGAVMNTGDDRCGQVTGPVQINIAESVSPVRPQNITITRQARTTDKRAETGNTEMGRKSFIPYGLYRTHGSIDANVAQTSTGMTEEDVKLLFQAILNMFKYDHSASRGEMRIRGLYVFVHASSLGNADFGDLCDKIRVEEKNPGVIPHSFNDYNVIVDRQMPDGVVLLENADVLKALNQ